MTTEAWRRSPKDFTVSSKKKAIADLNNDTNMLLDFRTGCILLNISTVTGHAMARKNELPGAVRVGHAWRFRRIPLHKFLYGEE